MSGVNGSTGLEAEQHCLNVMCLSFSCKHAALFVEAIGP